MAEITIVGAGLAGCEAALQLVARGYLVTLYEMRPEVMTPAHRTGDLAELVCSNSLKSDVLPSGQALLKAELRLLNSALLEIATATSVPAGKALAVDRQRFAREVTSRIEQDHRIEVRREEVTSLDSEEPVILATGPLTSDALSTWLEGTLGTSSLHFHDAISPIVEASSIDFSRLFRGDRYGHGGGDYWNIPLDQEAYRTFVRALREADTREGREWETLACFEGCLPIEEIAGRGDDALAFGPFRPVGLQQSGMPRSAAVIQLRRENLAGDCFNLVGCQTRLPVAEQRRVFRTLPGLSEVRFLRFGQLHRNTYLDSPRLLNPDLALRACPQIRVAGQLCGTEGYVESIGMGLLAALFTMAAIAQRPLSIPPPETMLGALCRYVGGAEGSFQPMNAHFGLLPPAPSTLRGKIPRRTWLCDRSLAAMESWIGGSSMW